MSDVKFTIFAAEDPWYQITSVKVMTVYGSYCEVEGYGQDCANAVAESYFSDTWDEWFGNQSDAVVIIEVISPAINKGFYEVSMDRIIKATSVGITDPRP